LNAMRAGGN